MNESQILLQGILDIESPLAPLENSFFSFWPIVILLCMTILAVYLGVRYYRSPRQRARQMYRKISRQYHERHIDAREMAFRLAATLQYGSRIPEHSLLSTRHEQVDGSHLKRWQQFQNTLTRARYAGDTSDINAQYLLLEARYWLRMGI